MARILELAGCFCFAFINPGTPQIQAILIQTNASLLDQARNIFRKKLVKSYES